MDKKKKTQHDEKQYIDIIFYRPCTKSYTNIVTIVKKCRQKNLFKYLCMKWKFWMQIMIILGESFFGGEHNLWNGNISVDCSLEVFCASFGPQSEWNWVEPGFSVGAWEDKSKMVPYTHNSFSSPRTLLSKEGCKK